ncbi:MAG TPA: bifunctional 4-hydroxy-2-oxoglutarate aldolase/2-dehydro-3-deoxy-phosphogluconate aldolase [Nocardioidaceae bacterium]|nr:bifunctional 4-hydroxy-2-oxoglutarate aldolase/2-dehydro-3-deoxy-phosphogluconate aldolase [Nocardioidaceae bacterium]
MSTLPKTSLLHASPVIPVVVVPETRLAVSLARALVAGGLRLMEITLRTPAAVESIRLVGAEVPDIVVGAGTVTTPEQAQAAAEAGARFLVSPGSTPQLLAAMQQTGLPHLPGVGTVSEVLAILERGYTEMKFFPAEPSGGTAFLKSVAATLPGARFCPTGGVTVESAPDYLALPNVASVGGSWITPSSLVKAQDWRGIADLAQQANRLRRTQSSTASGLEVREG